MRRRAESYLPVPFHTHPQLELPDWTNAWQWSSLAKDIIKYKKDGRDCYCMPGGQEKSLSVRSCTKYFNIVDEMNWAGFDDYTNHIRTVNYVVWVSKDWIKSKCSCVFWAKNYYCHHTISLAVHKKKAVFEDIHMEIAIN